MIDNRFGYPDDIPGLNYGNNSTADYFANSFAAAITNPDLTPKVSEQLWMAVLIDITK